MFSRWAAGADTPGSPMAPLGAEGDMTARSSPPMCGFAAKTSKSDGNSVTNSAGDKVVTGGLRV